MVDWDRVDQLRQKGLSWDDIASDPKVSFKPDASVTQAGPALRRLYYRRKSQLERQGPVEPTSRRVDPSLEKKWTLARIGFLLVPLVAVWAILAFVAPSPVGLLLNWFPWILIILGVAVVVLAYGLLRTSKRWSRTFRNTLVMGVVLGLVFTGLISLTAILLGCPFLPSSAALASQPATGWSSTPSYVTAWQQNGQPVMYFYGASWCPYCSASSWAIYKALTEFELNFNPNVNYGIPGTVLSMSSLSDVYAGTPEIVLANAQPSSQNMAFLVSEDTSGVDGTFPGTANCIQQAYVTAYSGSSIPFLAVNGQYIHGGSTIIDPSTLSTWAQGASGGASTVQTSVLQESGAAWSAIEYQAAWITAFLVKASGSTVATLTTTYHAQYQWSSNMQSMVNTDLSQIT